MSEKSTAKITDVAQAAGVSTATVSRFLNNSEAVSAEKRERIARAIQMLDYSPNFNAKNLRKGQSNVIALLVRDISNPNYMLYFSMAEKLAAQRGYLTVFCNAAMSPEREQEYFNHFASQGVAGVIAFTVRENDTNLKILEKSGIPTVLIDSNYEGNILSALTTDVYSGTYQGTQYLLSIGHRKIAYLCGNTELTTGVIRLQGYLDALRAFPEEVTPIYYPGKFSKEDAYEITTRILSTRKDITAIFAGSNQLTHGCFHALREQNIRIPEQISLLGFDDGDTTRFLDPPLTVVSRPYLKNIGFVAMNILLNHIEQKKTIEQISLDTPMQIILRQSCAAPSK